MCDIQVKSCKMCKMNLPLTEFYRTGEYYYQSRCKSCYNTPIIRDKCNASRHQKYILNYNVDGIKNQELWIEMLQKYKSGWSIYEISTHYEVSYDLLLKLKRCGKFNQNLVKTI